MPGVRIGLCSFLYIYIYMYIYLSLSLSSLSGLPSFVGFPDGYTSTPQDTSTEYGAPEKRGQQDFFAVQ